MSLHSLGGTCARCSRSFKSLAALLLAVQAVGFVVFMNHMTNRRQTQRQPSSTSNPLDMVEVKEDMNHMTNRRQTQRQPSLTSNPLDMVEVKEDEPTSGWHKLDPTFGNRFAFSAFYDNRSDVHSILIIGITESNRQDRGTDCFCRVWYSEGGLPEVTDANLHIHSHSHAKRYVESYFVCKLSNQMRVPTHVSVLWARTDEPEHRISVEHSTGSMLPTVDFTVCVSPLQLSYDNHLQLVEMIEVNRMFGAQRFFFYNSSIGKTAERYIKIYADEGIAHVVQWHLPVTVDQWPPDPDHPPEIHYYGQVDALNDCLYRNMFISRFVVFSDLDELITPRRHRTWIDLFNELSANNNNSDGAFVIRNTFFRDDWGNNGTIIPHFQLASQLQLKTLLATQRERLIFPWESRSKLIVRPRSVFWIGVHNVERLLGTSQVKYVPAEDALVHHYRLPMGDDPNNPPARVEDLYMQRFSQDILTRTKQRHAKVEAALLSSKDVRESQSKHKTLESQSKNGTLKS